MVIGVPLLILLLAIVAAASHRGGNATLLDWRPTRSPSREAELQHNEIAQMLAARNRFRRRRGAPEQSLQQAIESTHSKGLDT
jgi:ribosomal protein S3